MVDDGSTQYVNKIQPFKNRINYIRKENGGTASALNTGLRHATGKYFAWLSSDDMFLSNKVFDQLQFMQRKRAEISYTAFKTINEKNHIVNEVRSKQFRISEFRKMLLRGCPINGCTVMADIDLIKRVGLFNERLQYTQDYEMWCRISLKTPIKYLDDPLTLYRVHSNMGSVKNSQGIYQETIHVQKKYSSLYKAIEHDRRF